MTLKEDDAASLLKLLEDLNKRLEAGEEKAKAVKELEVPRPFRQLTVFQDQRKFGWQEVQKTAGQRESAYLVGNTDNSNTQFAILGLWAAQRHGVPTDPTFRVMVERFERSHSTSGQWAYGFTASSRPGYRYPASMACVGLLGLAIGRGTKLPTAGSPSPGKKDFRVLVGLTALYQNIGNPSGSMDNPVPLLEVYFLWTVERVAMLYNLPTIGDKDWYRWGAEILVTNQMRNGSWPGISEYQPAINALLKRPDYGPVLNTAFALLFLKRSHPMKELTPKLPFTAKELNEGIARLREGDNQGIDRLRESDKLLRGTTTPSSESRNLESKSRKRDP